MRPHCPLDGAPCTAPVLCPEARGRTAQEGVPQWPCNGSALGTGLSRNHAKPGAPTLRLIRSYSCRGAGGGGGFPSSHFHVEPFVSLPLRWCGSLSAGLCFTLDDTGRWCPDGSWGAAGPDPGAAQPPHLLSMVRATSCRHDWMHHAQHVMTPSQHIREMQRLACPSGLGLTN